MPLLNGLPCGDETLNLPVGELIRLDVAQTLVEYLHASVDDRSVTIDSENAQLVVPSLAPGSYDLKLWTMAPGLGSWLLCEAMIEVADSLPKITALVPSYDPATKKVHARAKGVALPENLNAILGFEGEDRVSLELLGTEGNERERVYVSSEPIVQETGVYQDFEIEVLAQTLFKAGGRWFNDGSAQWRWQKFKSSLDAKLHDLFEEEQSGIIELVGNDFSFSRIGAGEYSLGLKPEDSKLSSLLEKRLAGPSSLHGKPLGIRLVRPFLISTYEVTNLQFLTYVVEAEPPAPLVPESLRPYRIPGLPPDKIRLPVTGLSFIEARGFVQWLQGKLDEKTSRWQIRLPHEVEWEMAARGTGTASYAFKDNDMERGIASLNIDHLRPVGTNTWDRSSFGVRDMTGNAREWTESVFHEAMLDMLKVLQSDAIEGWDPTSPPDNLFERLPEKLDPNFSRNMTVRGGANGEDPEFHLLSLRRQLEMSATEPDLGFRLVLVKMEGR